MFDARLEDAKPAGERIGLVVGCTLAGVGGMINFAEDVRVQSARFVSPLRFPQTVGNYLAGALARNFNLRGPNLTLATEDESGGVRAIAEAIAILRSDAADVVIAGGINCVPDALAAGVEAMNATLCDGACLFVVETQRAAKSRTATILAQICLDDCRDSHPAESISVTAVANGNETGSILAEQWFGRYGAAAGASAMALGLAAIQGLAVPFGPSIDGTQVRAMRPNSALCSVLVKFGSKQAVRLTACPNNVA